MKKNSSFPLLLLITFVVVLLLSQTGLVTSFISDVDKSLHDLKNTVSFIEKANRQTVSDYLFEEYKIPHYSEQDVIILNENIPFFDMNEITQTYWNEEGIYYPFIGLTELDELGRAGSATMCAGPETLADEERESIEEIKPSGWMQAYYEDLITDKALYNRCHLLAHNLSELNAEERNLITCTRQMNAEEMLNYEIKIADYIEDTGNHVLYRVTPLYIDNELVARGCLMEALSLEESGLNFCIFVYNVQDGIDINYETGNSSRK